MPLLIIKCWCDQVASNLRAAGGALCSGVGWRFLVIAGSTRGHHPHGGTTNKTVVGGSCAWSFVRRRHHSPQTNACFQALVGASQGLMVGGRDVAPPPYELPMLCSNMSNALKWAFHILILQILFQINHLR